jgi:protein-disulfide isomerase-like protein with CxxC motif
VAVWLQAVKKMVGDEIDINWKCFSLEQDHSTEGEDFKLWDHPERTTRSLKALQAAKCAQLQGTYLFEPFHMLLFEAFHREPKDTTSDKVLAEIAGKANLDVKQFLKDLKSEQSRKLVGKDHCEGVEKYRLFGVPTLIIDESRPFFLKLGRLTDSTDEQVSFFHEIQQIIYQRPYLLELKST